MACGKTYSSLIATALAVMTAQSSRFGRRTTSPLRCPLDRFLL